ncbi:hypothetical protein VTJ04DRAFT_8527 [Mycothermus thermophilus]
MIDDDEARVFEPSTTSETRRSMGQPSPPPW